MVGFSQNETPEYHLKFVGNHQDIERPDSVSENDEPLFFTEIRNDLAGKVYYDVEEEEFVYVSIRNMYEKYIDPEQVDNEDLHYKHFKHFFYEQGGYPIDTVILEQFEKWNISKMIIFIQDLNEVYEFSPEQYRSQTPFDKGHGEQKVEEIDKAETFYDVRRINFDGYPDEIGPHDFD